MQLKRNYFKDILFGIAVGDALGVPVEFQSRAKLKLNPVIGMTEGGIHEQPIGTWSDDSSLTFCLAEALLNDFNLHRIADNFISWLYENYWTATGEVFDVGITTRESIERLVNGVRPDLAGGFYTSSNGNGSLMRILPLLFYIKDKPIEDRYELIKLVSSITHGHIRSVVACFYYMEFARTLLINNDKFATYKALQTEVSDFLNLKSINPEEIKLFDRLFQLEIYNFPEDEINSSGYVLHSLEASIWCLMTTNSYKDAVLKAVNLGNDTDTVAAITGGLAGLLYDFQTIPETWLTKLARSKDIEDLADRMSLAYRTNNL